MPMGPIMFDIEGLTLMPNERELLKHPHTGGVIFFANNYKSPEQLIELTQSIRSVKPNILIAVDQEGGRVQRFRDSFTRIPPMQKVGQIYDQNNQLGCEFAESCGWLMATEVLAVGVDFSFAPILDLDKQMSKVIGDRALHRDLEIVVKLAGCFIQGMNRAGMASVGKHFPGHGSVASDSHLDLPVDDRVLEEVAKDDLVPFVALKDVLAGIMPTHILFPKIDELPVGFSKYWLSDILRTQIGYQGAIFSDDLSMEGAKKIGDIQTRAQFALDAGCDMILICHDRDAVESLLDIQLNRDALSEDRLSQLKCGEHLTWKDLRKNRDWHCANNLMKEI